MKTTFSNGKINKTQFIKELLEAGVDNPAEIKKQLDFLTGEDTKLNYIFKKRTELQDKIKENKAKKIKQVIQTIEKSKREQIKEEMEQAILIVCKKTQGIDDQKVIGDLFSSILSLGNK